MSLNNPYIPGDPYSYDLKWIVDRLKEAIDLYEPLNNKFDDLKAFVEDYFENLDLTEEVRGVIQDLQTNGYFDLLIYQIAVTDGNLQTIVTNWLNDNVTPVGSAVVVDDTLTIQGAAADSKKVGDTFARYIAGNEVREFTDPVSAPYDDLNTYPVNVFSLYTNCNVANTPYTNPAAQRFAIISFASYRGTPSQGSVQMIFDANDVYVRFSYGANMSAWRRIARSVDMIPGTIATLSAPYDDLNTFPNNSFTIYEAAATPANCPVSNTAFAIFSYNSYPGLPRQGSTQILTTRTQAFIRFGYGQFGPWHEISNKDGIVGSVQTIIDKPLNIDAANDRFLFAGDSITDVYSIERGDPWPNYLMTKLGVPSSHYKNIAAQSVDFAADGPHVIDKIQTEFANTTNYDYMFIAAGVNDYHAQIPLATFRTALDTLSTYISGSAFNGKVIIITPLPNPASPIGALSIDLIKYSEQLFAWAMENDYEVINGFDLGFFYVDDAYSQIVFADGLHPTDIGEKMMSKGIATALF